MTARDPALSALLAEATSHLAGGRNGAAADAYRAALARDPGLADAWYNLGWAERGQRRFEAALAAFGRALEAGIDRPEDARLNRAILLSEHLHDSGAAIAELETATGINPQFVPGWLNLGLIREDLGQMEQAAAAYRTVLDLDPGDGRAAGRLAMIVLAKGEGEAAEAQLRQALDRAQTLEDRREILFALGAALDRQGRYDAAFEVYEAANAHARATAQSRYQPAAQAAAVDRAIEGARGASALVPVTVGDARPVFICGMFRSGSTLAEHLIGRHSRITAGGELDAIPAIAQGLGQRAADLDERQVSALRDEYLAALPASGIVTDKRCDNILHVGLIKRLFPDAKILHTRRNPIDTILSVYFLDFDEGVPYGSDLAEIVDYYVQYRRLIAHWRRLYPDDILDVDYERVVREPEQAIGEALRFLELDWEARCLVADTAAPVRTASALQVRQALHTRSSGRWRNYAGKLDEVRAMLARAGVADA